MNKVSDVAVGSFFSRSATVARDTWKRSMELVGGRHCAIFTWETFFLEIALFHFLGGSGGSIFLEMAGTMRGELCEFFRSVSNFQRGEYFLGDSRGNASRAAQNGKSRDFK